MHRPSGSPECWSRQYDETDYECQGCEYQNTCRTASLSSYPVPVTTMNAPPPPWSQYHRTPSAPPTRLPIYQGTPGVATVPRTPTPVPATPSPAQSPSSPYQQKNYHFVNHYGLYEGETITQRLTKHIILKLGEVFFAELAQFFRLWRWPPL